MTTQQKIEALSAIAKEINLFKGLEIAKTATHAVPGEGNPDAQIMFIGEAPGREEDLTGRPFVGQSGQLMRRVLTETTGIKPEEVFITNIVKFRPPDNRDPTELEIETCKNWLDRQIQIIGPKIIVTLGRFSMAKFITGVSISRVHGQPRLVNFLNSRYIVFPMFHPAAALRSGEVMNQFKKDFSKLSELLKSPVSMSSQVVDSQSIAGQQQPLF